MAQAGWYLLADMGLQYLRADLKGEGLIEDGTKVLALDFGLKLLFLVRQHVDFDIWIGSPAHIHGSQVLSLEDANYQLGEKRGEDKRKYRAANPERRFFFFTQSLFSIISSVSDRWAAIVCLQNTIRNRACVHLVIGEVVVQRVLQFPKVLFFLLFFPVLTLLKHTHTHTHICFKLLAECYNAERQEVLTSRRKNPSLLPSRSTATFFCSTH